MRSRARSEFRGEKTVRFEPEAEVAEVDQRVCAVDTPVAPGVTEPAVGAHAGEAEAPEAPTGPPPELAPLGIPGLATAPGLEPARRVGSLSLHAG
eukprot:7204027-Alexandrium_andersonii.AAC.1